VTRRAPAILLLLAACAAAKPPSPAFRQAEHGLPAEAELPEGPDRAAYAAARAREAAGDAAGAAEPARAEWAQAAAGYAAAADRPGAAAWRVPLRLRAAELLLRAQRWDGAAEAAEALVADPEASQASKAVGARLAATAALGAAGAAARAGQLERLDLGATRPGGEGGPRTPPAPWKRVVDSTDAYLARAGADPEASRPPAERRPGVSPAELALVAAEVRYAYGDLEDARRRLEAAMDRWPAEAEVIERAVPLYLATFGDRAGHDEAVERLRARIAPEAARATGAREREAFARALEALARERAGARFGAAERLLAEGKAAEAAREFEAVAAEPGLPEPASALHDAAVAWDQAGDPARSAALRERIVREHPTSQVAPEDALALADHHSRRGDPLASARAYDDYLSRWPEAPGRCIALQNVASELERAGRPAEAAARFKAFGRDERCAKAAPDVAARALVVAGRLFDAQAREAYGAALEVPGVADPEARKLVGEAKRRLRGP
jgi:hypothetical protein